jgi:hypothetical protein
MSRISYLSVVSLVLIAVAGGNGVATAQGGPAAAGLAAEVKALQSQVTDLRSQIATLQGAVAALQTAAGTVQVWKDAHVAVSVQRNDATFVSDWTLSTMASVSLPAGTYLVVAKTSLQDPVVSASTFYCELARSTGLIDESVAYSVTDEPETMALQAVVTLAAPDTVALKCGATGPASTPGSAESFLSQIAALKATL